MPEMPHEGMHDPNTCGCDLCRAIRGEPPASAPPAGQFGADPFGQLLAVGRTSLVNIAAKLEQLVGLVAARFSEEAKQRDAAYIEARTTAESIHASLEQAHAWMADKGVLDEYLAFLEGGEKSNRGHIWQPGEPT